MKPSRTVAALVALAFSASLAAPFAEARPPRVYKPSIGAVDPSAKALASAYANPTQAAQAIAGPGVTVSNASWKGNIGIGAFSGALAEVGIDSGVVLTTGYLNTIFRPNADPDTSDIHDFSSNSSDADLEAIVAPYDTYDATVLEFDITTSATSITIQYVFASEEYNEFVDSEYNDVFAFFVNGANCARVNGQPVTVNTINAGENPALFVNNTGAVRAIEFDGLTVVLTCSAQVTPNVPNRVKLAIADVSDPIYDAAVFIATAGINAGTPQPGQQALAVEYFHGGMGHYFVTSIPGEVTALDTNPSLGWARTGETFTVWSTGTGLADVCRLFTTFFAPKSSHFYTAIPFECNLLVANPIWVFETGSAFKVVLPSGGVCPIGVKLYRLYNNAQGGAANHRYTTSLAIRQQMINQGFVPEDGAEWCVLD